MEVLKASFHLDITLLIFSRWLKECTERRDREYHEVHGYSDLGGPDHGTHDTVRLPSPWPKDLTTLRLKQPYVYSVPGGLEEKGWPTSHTLRAIEYHIVSERSDRVAVSAECYRIESVEYVARLLKEVMRHLSA